MRVTDLRPEVLALAFAMETTLRKHDAKKGERGWKDMSPYAIAGMLHAETRSLRLEVLGGTPGSRTDKVLSKAADTANVVMMTADVMDALSPFAAVVELDRLRRQDERDAERLFDDVLADERAVNDDDLLHEMDFKLGGTD